MKKYFTNNYAETRNVGLEIGKALQPGNVIAMFGDLGAGKTSITAGITEGYGINCRVSSPTFSIVNEYKENEKVIYHFDMYRITDWDDLYSTGYYDYLDSGAVLIIEWSENIEQELPDDYIRLEINKCEDDEKREIIFGRKDEFENSCS